MKPNQIEGCKTIANYYGRDSQVLIAIEEMSELTKVICKYKRRFEVEEQLVDEIADVKIMVEQLTELFKLGTEVDKRIDYKIERQLRRIQSEMGE